MRAEVCLQWLQYANMAATILLVWRLCNQGLHRAYRWFFIYLVFDLIESFSGLIPLQDRGIVYRYVAGQAIKTTLAAFVVLEIYRLALAERKALARFGWNLAVCAFVGSFLLSVIFLLSSAKGPTIFPLLRYTLALEGVMDSTQLLFLCAMGVFLAWFPIDLRKNLAVYISGFVVYFSARWIILLLRRTSQSEWFNIASYAITLVCIGFWIWAMQAAGEREKTTTGHR
jgi:hypothetical protein